MKISELIAILQTKDQDASVQYIVVKGTGEVVTALVGTQAKPMIKVLKLFGDRP